MGLYVHSPIRLLGVVLNLLYSGTTLPVTYYTIGNASKTYTPDCGEHQQQARIPTLAEFEVPHDALAAMTTVQDLDTLTWKHTS
jgi:hypothetical protein